jgi:hypothetical protein
VAPPDRPPGRRRESGPVATPSRPNATPSRYEGVIQRVVDGAVSERQRAVVLAVSDERDLWHDLVVDAWRDGYRAGRESRASDYARGRIDGFAARKAAMHDATVAAMDDHLAYLARWGPGGREHFADPRPGDYMGGPVPSW